MKIACQGIDRYFVRYYAKGPRRRPVQIDFCEQRRPGRVRGLAPRRRRAPAGAGESEEAAQAGQRKRSLPDHLDRVCERVTARRAGMTPPPAEFDAVLEMVTQEAAAFRDLPGPIRGETRERSGARLVELDRADDRGRAGAGRSRPLLQTLRAEATEAAAAVSRPDARRCLRAARSTSAVDRLLREHENCHWSHSNSLVTCLPLPSALTPWQRGHPHQSRNRSPAAGCSPATKGRSCFVAGAFPDERVRARVERVSRHLAFADTMEVLEPSPDRAVFERRLGVRRFAVRPHRIPATAVAEIGPGR